MRGEGRIFKRGRLWHIAYYGPGEHGAEEIRESTGSEKELAAKKLLRKRIQEVANHRGGVRAFQGPAHERLTVTDLIDSLEADYARRSQNQIQGILTRDGKISQRSGRDHLAAHGIFGL